MKRVFLFTFIFITMILMVSCGKDHKKPLDFQFLDIKGAEGLFLKTNKQYRGVTSRSVENEGALYKIYDGTSELVKAKDSNSTTITNFDLTYRYLKVLNKDWVLLKGYYNGTEYEPFDGTILCNTTNGKIYLINPINYMPVNTSEYCEPKIVDNSLFVSFDDSGVLKNMYKIDLSNPEELQMSLYIQGINNYRIFDNGAIIYNYDYNSPTMIKFPNGNVEVLDEHGSLLNGTYVFGNSFLDLWGNSYYEISDSSFEKYTLYVGYSDANQNIVLQYKSKIYLFAPYRYAAQRGSGVKFTDLSNLPTITEVKNFESIESVDFAVGFDETKILLFGSCDEGTSKKLICYDISTDTESSIIDSDKYIYLSMYEFGDKVAITAIRKHDGKKVFVYCDGVSMQVAEELTHEVISIQPIN